MNKKTFAHGSRAIPGTNYYVARKKLARTLFNHIINKSPFCTLAGASQSGKTTLALEIMDTYKNDYTFIYLDLQRGGYKDEFWACFTTEVNRQMGCHESVLDQKSFYSLFANEKHQNQKPVVIILDELGYIVPEVKSEPHQFFSAIRFIKQNPGNFVLRSVIGVGVFGTLGNPTELSPLRLLTDRVYSVPFSLKEADNLFGQYMEDTGRRIEQEVIEDVFQLTNGQTGMVGFLGHFLALHVAKGSVTTFEEWKKVSMFQLQRSIVYSDVGVLVGSYLQRNIFARQFLLTCRILTQETIDYPVNNSELVLTLTKIGILHPAHVRETMEKAMSSVDSVTTEADEVLIRQAIEYRHGSSVSSGAHMEIDNSAQDSQASELVDADLDSEATEAMDRVDSFSGVHSNDPFEHGTKFPSLTSTALNELEFSSPSLEFSSPLMRSIVMHLVSPRTRISEWIFENWLDFITLTVPLMDVNAIFNTMSAKNDGGDFVPSEHAFHYEFHRVLCELVPVGDLVHPQVGGVEHNMGNLQLDVTINSNRNIGIELTANTSVEDNAEHIKRFQKGYAVLGLKTKGVIHFVTKEKFLKVPSIDMKDIHFTNVFFTPNSIYVMVNDVKLDLQPHQPFTWRDNKRVVPTAVKDVVAFNTRAAVNINVEDWQANEIGDWAAQIGLSQESINTLKTVAGFDAHQKKIPAIKATLLEVLGKKFSKPDLIKLSNAITDLGPDVINKWADDNFIESIISTSGSMDLDEKKIEKDDSIILMSQ